MAAYLLLDDIARRNLRRERVFKDRLNPLDSLNDGALIERYRFPRNIILDIVRELEADVAHYTNRSHSIPAHLQVLVTLRFLAKGCFLSETADLHGISKPSASRCVTRVSTAICNNFANAITFPSTQEAIRRTKEECYRVSHFPNVVGIVDGTLVPILAPSTDEPAYVCRKNYHALNVQAVSDANMKFLNVVSQWPGSVHDAFIWANCSLSAKFERREIDGWILGDSGYPLRPWLLTPKRNPVTQADRRYNRAFKSTRCIVERAFGVLKSRFRCLHKSGGCLLFSPEKCCSIILATFKLHNICIDNNLPAPELIDLEDDQDEDLNYTYDGELNDGEVTRRTLIETRFTDYHN